MCPVISTFADDTAIVAVDQNPNTAPQKLQDHLSSVGDWLRTWRINVNQAKWMHITFTTRSGQCPQVYIYQQPNPRGTSVKYLGMHLGSK